MRFFLFIALGLLCSCLGNALEDINVHEKACTPVVQETIDLEGKCRQNACGEFRKAGGWWHIWDDCCNDTQIKR